MRCAKCGAEIPGSGGPCAACKSFSTGRDLAREGDYDGALPRYQEAVRMGHTGAMNSLAVLYLAGKGTLKDPQGAFDLFLRAAQQGGPTVAMRNVAQCYREGLGVKANLFEAVNWYKKAAKLGDPWACQILGEGYGSKGFQDWVEEEYAQYWYTKAAELGDDMVKYASALALAGLSDVVGESKGTVLDVKAAVVILRQMAAGGHKGAMAQCGYLYEMGRGVPQSGEMAADWYEKAGYTDRASMCRGKGNQTGGSVVPLSHEHRRAAAAPVTRPTPQYPQSTPAATSSGDLTTTKTLSETDVKYKICTFGAAFHIGFGQPVTLKVNGNRYPCKSHNSSKGRIDGLKQMYSQNGLDVGDVIRAVYDSAENCIVITRA